MHNIKIYFFKKNIALIIILFSFFLTFDLLSARAEQFIQKFENGEVNWTSGLVTASAVGQAPEDYYSNASVLRDSSFKSTPSFQGSMHDLAKQQALNKSRLRLKKTLANIRIFSEKKVGEMLLSKPELAKELNGLLHNSLILDQEEIEQAKIKVKTGLKLRKHLLELFVSEQIWYADFSTLNLSRAELGFGNFTKAVNGTKENNASKSSQEEEFWTGNCTGLVLDARNYGVQPSLFFRVFSPQGEILLDPNMVDKEEALENGYATYVTGVDASLRVGKDPCYIKVRGTTQDSASDLIVSKQGARLIKQIYEKSRVLKQCRIAVLLETDRDSDLLEYKVH